MKNKQLICLDFDGTVTEQSGNLNHRKHFSYESCDFGIYPLLNNENNATSISRSTITLKHPQMLQETIIKWLKDGNSLCITSFSRNLASIQSTLKELLHDKFFDEHCLNSIKIICGVPAEYDLQEVGKNIHIKLATSHYGIATPTDVILVDDDRLNVSIAQQNGYKAILVPRASNDVSYLEKLNHNAQDIDAEPIVLNEKVTFLLSPTEIIKKLAHRLEQKKKTTTDVVKNNEECQLKLEEDTPFIINPEFGVKSITGDKGHMYDSDEN